MALLLNGLLAALLLLYPLVVYFGLQHWKTRDVAVVLIVALTLRALIMQLKNLGGAASHDDQEIAGPLSKKNRWLVMVAIGLLLLVFVFDDIIYFKYYPLAVNVFLLVLFSATLLKPPTMVERLARLQEPDLPDTAVPYTRRVTQFWCLFFIVNACVSFYTACCMPLEMWTLYNGLIAYLLMGLAFAIEWLVRQIVRKKHRAAEVDSDRSTKNARYKSG